jgi:hypothetical protein
VTRRWWMTRAAWRSGGSEIVKWRTRAVDVRSPSTLCPEECVVWTAEYNHGGCTRCPHEIGDVGTGSFRWGFPGRTRTCRGIRLHCCTSAEIDTVGGRPRYCQSGGVDLSKSEMKICSYPAVCSPVTGFPCTLKLQW